MSHFSYIQTQYQNLFYLKKALNNLNISYLQNNSFDSKQGLSKNSLIIPQSNGSNIYFCWNGNEYDLVSDFSFWIQAASYTTFLQNISKEYATTIITNEGQKIGFQPIQYQTNHDGSRTITLERLIS